MSKNDKWETAIGTLLTKDPWTAYIVQRDILGATGKELETARLASIGSPLVQSLVADLGTWPGKRLSSHKSAEQLFHKLSLAAEFGLARKDPGAGAIAASVMSRISEEGPFAVPMEIGVAYGGTGKETLAWALCDAPVTLRALVRMGFGGDKTVIKGVKYLSSLAGKGLSGSGGWPCASSGTLGSWRGPGKKTDPCPYATLATLELLLELPEASPLAKASAPLVEAGAARLLELWEGSRELHPYIFYMGNDFRKLKAPLIWYDLLHVLDALVRVGPLRKNPRLGEMLDVLEGKAEADGLFIPESVYLTWKDYDFGRKKKPSAYLSAVSLRILKRAGRIAR